GDVVAQPGGTFEVHLVGGTGHLLLEPANVPARISLQEACQVVDDRSMLLGVHTSYAGCGALVDIAQQTRPSTGGSAPEHTSGAAAHREHPEQLVEGLPDSP